MIVDVSELDKTLFYFSSSFSFCWEVVVSLDLQRVSSYIELVSIPFHLVFAPLLRKNYSGSEDQFGFWSCTYLLD